MTHQEIAELTDVVFSLQADKVALEEKAAAAVATAQERAAEALQVAATAREEYRAADEAFQSRWADLQDAVAQLGDPS